MKEQEQTHQQLDEQSKQMHENSKNRNNTLDTTEHSWQINRNKNTWTETHEQEKENIGVQTQLTAGWMHTQKQKHINRNRDRNRKHTEEQTQNKKKTIQSSQTRCQYPRQRRQNLVRVVNATKLITYLALTGS